MKVVAQLAKEASVTVREEVIGKIGKGFMLLVGITHGDTEADLDYIVNKLIHLRVFEDADGKMNESLLQTGGDSVHFAVHSICGHAEGTPAKFYRCG